MWGSVTVPVPARAPAPSPKGPPNSCWSRGTGRAESGSGSLPAMSCSSLLAARMAICSLILHKVSVPGPRVGTPGPGNRALGLWERTCRRSESGRVCTAGAVATPTTPTGEVSLRWPNRRRQILVCVLGRGQAERREERGRGRSPDSTRLGRGSRGAAGRGSGNRPRSFTWGFQAL